MSPSCGDFCSIKESAKTLTEHFSNMKIFALFGIALATDEVPHDPEALAFCHNACQGKENFSDFNKSSLLDTEAGLSETGYCPDGFYPSFKDCDAYYLCWDAGNWGDKVTFL